ncbi:hypothetical protein BDV96DRAFT_193160 [Lophiotrema nucula]|uniref:Uncharacterized protein n=1 Tax=Lophiotrema nucula TaxID=690887 RepID=A0A6A5YV96_9PLEO|nr:hypothetical protein BDV96DRAFT_193160 [Lophiotrema nucula]
MQFEKDFYSFSSHLARAFAFQKRPMGQHLRASDFDIGFESLEVDFHYGTVPFEQSYFGLNRNQIKRCHTYPDLVGHTSSKIRESPTTPPRDPQHLILTASPPDQPSHTRKRVDSMRPYGAHEGSSSTIRSEANTRYTSTAPPSNNESSPRRPLEAPVRPSSIDQSTPGTGSDGRSKERVLVKAGTTYNNKEAPMLTGVEYSRYPLLLAKNTVNDDKRPSKRRRGGNIDKTASHAEGGLDKSLDVDDGSFLRLDEKSTQDRPLHSPSTHTKSTVQVTGGIPSEHQSGHAGGGIQTGEEQTGHQWLIPCPCEQFPVLFQAELEVQHEIITSMCVHEVNKLRLWKTKKVGQNSYICYAKLAA